MRILLILLAFSLGCSQSGDDDDDNNGTPLWGGLVTSDVDPSMPGAGVTSPWLYGGDDSIGAGNLMCQDAGFDRVCMYQELQVAVDQGELDDLPLLTTGWVWRLEATVVVNGNQVPAHPGNRCVDFLDSAQNSDGEYFAVEGGAGIVFYFDEDPLTTDPVNLQCGGEARGVPCCI